MKNRFNKLITLLVLVSCFSLLGCASQPTPSAEEKPAVSENVATPEIVPAPVPQTPVSPNAMSADVVMEKLKPLRNDQGEIPVLPKKGSEFLVSLPTDRPRGDEKSEWITSYISVFYERPEQVDQISIITMNCKTDSKTVDKKKIHDRVVLLVKTVSEQVFGSPFQVSDRYFKELGPVWTKQVQVPIRETHPGARSMRISRGLYKCDGHSGVGFRFDFFTSK